MTERVIVAFLGLGQKGRPMAARLLDAGRYDARGVASASRCSPIERLPATT